MYEHQLFQTQRPLKNSNRGVVLQNVLYKIHAEMDLN